LIHYFKFAVRLARLVAIAVAGLGLSLPDSKLSTIFLPETCGDLATVTLARLAAPGSDRSILVFLGLEVLRFPRELDTILDVLDVVLGSPIFNSTTSFNTSISELRLVFSRSNIASIVIPSAIFTEVEFNGANRLFH
jgi:hypothetical protein